VPTRPALHACHSIASLPNIRKFLPSEAGRGIFHVLSDRSGDLAPWTGFGLFFAYAVIMLVAGAILLNRRDA